MPDYLNISVGGLVLPIEVADPLPPDAIMIDQEWLDARTAPYILDTAGGYYALDTDVTVDETAFLVTAAGTTFDLQGHTVTYNNATRTAVPNEDFSEETGGAPNNWDVSSAGTYTLRDVSGSNLEYPVGLFGTRCLRITLPPSPPSGTCTASVSNPCTITTSASHGLSSGDYVILNGFSGYLTGEYRPSRVLSGLWKITVTGANTFTVNADVTALSDSAGDWYKATSTLTSSAVSIARSGRLYACSIQPACDPSAYPAYHIAVRLEKSDGTEIPYWNYYKEAYAGTYFGSIVGNGRNFAPVAVVKPTDTSDLRLRIGLASARTSGDIAVDLGRVRFSQAYDTGIHAGGDNWIQWPPRDNHGNSTTNINGLTVTDTVGGGSITQGVNRGFRGDAVCTHRVWNLNVNNVSLFLTGDDTYAVRANGMGNAGSGAVRDCTIEYAAGVDVTTRFYAPSAAYVTGLAGSVEVAGNTITNNPSWGIVANSNSGNPLIYNNTIYPNITKTNGYQLSASNRSRIYSNVVDARSGSGRGIYCAAGQSQTLEDVEIYNNTIYVRETPNVEYLTSIAARALRVRNQENGDTTNGTLLNVDIHDNYFYAETSPGDPSTGCYGARLSVRYNGNGMDSTSFRFNNNTCVAVDKATSTNVVALSIGQWPTGNALPEMDGNVLESNQCALRFGDSDDGHDVIGVSLTNTVLTRLATSGSSSWTPVLIGYSTAEYSGLSLLNNTFVDCALNEMTFGGTGYRDVKAGWLVDVVTQDSVSHDPIPNAALTITDTEDTIIVDSSTSESGMYTSTPLATTRYEKTGSAAVVTTVLTPFSVAATATGYNAYSDLFTPVDASNLSIELTPST